MNRNNKYNKIALKLNIANTINNYFINKTNSKRTLLFVYLCFVIINNYNK